MLRHASDGKPQLRQRQCSSLQQLHPNKQTSTKKRLYSQQKNPFHPDASPHNTAQPHILHTTMPLRLWPKRSKRKQLETRTRRLEKKKKRFATTLDVYNHWNETASGNGLTRRIAALENWQENTDTVLLWLMKDLTVAERKLNRFLPVDDDNDDDNDDDDDDKVTSKRSSTAATSSLDVSSDNNVGPDPMLSPGGTPLTFTRRKSNSAERVTLDGSGLRLPRSAKTIKCA